MKSKFAPSQITLHWLVFILIAIAYATIELRGYADRGTTLRAAMISTHFGCGAAVLMLMSCRILLRLKHPSPAIIPPPPAWQVWLAKLMHWLIYLIFIALPVLGLISRYLRGTHWALFGIAMPTAVPGDGDIAGDLIDWHETLASAGYWLIGLHAAAALLHHYFIKDNTLRRMMPARRNHSE
ncbi:cytochrome b561 [Izhakiella capsodis]|uniref:Cytochrome b561 n=1 Tax=Izhakiella capsodis TaxID=1367852 RepID=A0A1I4ZP47_9GAMM|nr:cytochrome b561 [Izhakiella capsodis]SFN51749.1 cytochrome b561 [Izhakiella capsodis]